MGVVQIELVPDQLKDLACLGSLLNLWQSSALGLSCQEAHEQLTRFRPGDIEEWMASSDLVPGLLAAHRDGDLQLELLQDGCSEALLQGRGRLRARVQDNVAALNVRAHICAPRRFQA